MTPDQVTAAIKRRLRSHPDFVHLSVHTQSALGGRYNVCTIIVNQNYRIRHQVLKLALGDDIGQNKASNTSSGAIVITLPKDQVIR